MFVHPRLELPVVDPLGVLADDGEALLDAGVLVRQREANLLPRVHSPVEGGPLERLVQLVKAGNDQVPGALEPVLEDLLHIGDVHAVLLVLVEQLHHAIELDGVDVALGDAEHLQDELPEVGDVDEPVEVLIHNAEGGLRVESVRDVPLVGLLDDLVRPVEVVGFLFLRVTQEKTLHSASRKSFSKKSSQTASYPPSPASPDPYN